MRLNPFEKPLHEVDADDLPKLAEFCEQLHVEYKGPGKWGQSSDIAKSIASFANAWGGWLFIGLHADEDNRPLIGQEEIIGVPQSNTQPEETLYQLASAHLSPRPHFVVHVIKIDASHFVAAIAIPESQDPPHIHLRSGTVPVRDGSRTEPVRIDNRAELDRLYQKAQANRAAVKALLDEHEHGAFLNRYLRRESHHLWGSRQREAYWRCLFYPRTAIEGLFPYAIQREFPKCPWPGRGYIDLGSEDYCSGAPLRKFTADGAYVLSGEEKGYYVSTYGHFCYGAGISSLNHARHGLEERVARLADHAMRLYVEAGYHGEVAMEYCLGPYGTIRGTVTRFTDVHALPNLVELKIGDEVARVLGMWDQSGRA